MLDGDNNGRKPRSPHFSTTPPIPNSIPRSFTAPLDTHQAIGMAMDSPLAVLPLRGPFHRDLFTQTLQHPNARSFTFGRLNDFDQGKSTTKRPSGDYFSLSNIRGSSPSSLAIEMSQSMNIEPMFNSRHVGLSTLP